MNHHLDFLITLPRGRLILIFTTALVWGALLLLLPASLSQDRPRPQTLTKAPQTLLTHFAHPNANNFAFVKEPRYIFVLCVLSIFPFDARLITLFTVEIGEHISDPPTAPWAQPGSSYSADGWDGKSDPSVPYAKRSSADGPQWVRRLADLSRNTTQINLAFHGATVDNMIVTYSDDHLDFKGQTDAFIHWFSGTSPQARAVLPWTGKDSFFIVELGTNDVMLAFSKATRLGGSMKLYLHENIVDHYIGNVDQLYQRGARAFSFSLVGPLHRTPMVAGWGDHFKALLQDHVISFNHILVRSIDAYCGKRPDMFCFVDDTYSLFSRILDWPSEHGIKEAKGFCKAYIGRLNAEADSYADPSCVGPVSDYFWADQLHPSFSVHKIWAETMRDTLLRRLGLPSS
ncbi:hypothetical protein AURDEDRAFT_158202 [Auricularia subglabra TFB-10046 SS5]|nr:hypothetical protein AURDEDRAFT_158202 [Auricularia subglabra TFB-10046 SS5]